MTDWKAIHLGAVALLAATAGCSWSHRFHLEDLDQVIFGESPLKDVDRILGVPDSSITGTSFSSEQEVFPPSPWSFFSWPLLLTRHSGVYFLKDG